MSSGWMRALALIGVLIAATGCATEMEGTLPGTSVAAGTLNTIVEWVVVLLEGAGIVVIVGGSLAATVYCCYTLSRDGPSREKVQRYRENLGQVILVGLEFLVAADIVGTVAISPSFKTVGALALIILIRTFLSFTLEVETTGYWPWERPWCRSPRE
ncbi:MAG: DUF1622 domain-containing protein [Anaerolineae bacterium]